jgi:hypothetical protein
LFFLLEVFGGELLDGAVEAAAAAAAVVLTLRLERFEVEEEAGVGVC